MDIYKESATIDQFSSVIRKLDPNDINIGPHALLTGVSPNKQGHTIPGSSCPTTRAVDRAFGYISKRRFTNERESIGGSSKQGRCDLVHVIYSFGGIVHVVNVGGSKARPLYKHIDREFCGNVEKRGVHYTLFSWYCSLAYKTSEEQYEAHVKTITYASEDLMIH